MVSHERKNAAFGVAYDLEPQSSDNTKEAFPLLEVGIKIVGHEMEQGLLPLVPFLVRRAHPRAFLFKN